MSEYPLPEWATGTTDGIWEIGAQMRTRDGRRTGNGVIVAMDGDFNLEACRITIITDSGNKVVFTPGEVMGHFYHPEWIMDLSKHMGVQKYNDEHPCDHRIAKPVATSYAESYAEEDRPKGWGSTLHLNSVIYNQALQVKCPTCGRNANDQCVDENNDALLALTVHQSREDECPF